jgi:hypothetical protein
MIFGQPPLRRWTRPMVRVRFCQKRTWEERIGFPNLRQGVVELQRKKKRAILDDAASVKLRNG